MKKLISLGLLVCILATSISGCGKEKVVEKGRELYNDDLTNYVELGEYKGIEVDKSSEKFEAYYEEVIESDIANNNFFTRSDAIKDGKVEDGDIANIDYCGKKDGVAFDGGTAQGYDLEIGSGSFIDGFEDGLIGVEIGSTVDLNLTFPKAYKSADLAGEDVVFTVTVNSVKKRVEEQPESYYSKLNYETVEAYYEYVENTATENYLLNSVIQNSKINKYPKTDVDFLLNSYVEKITYTLSNQYGTNYETYVQNLGQTVEEFERSIIEDTIEPMMDTQMLMYAIFDAEKFKLEESKIKAKINETLISIGNSSVTEQMLLEYYGAYYFEQLAVTEMVTDFILENAKIS